MPMAHPDTDARVTNIYKLRDAMRNSEASWEVYRSAGFLANSAIRSKVVVDLQAALALANIIHSGT
jgi:hypothetical protein